MVCTVIVKDAFHYGSGTLSIGGDLVVARLHDSVVRVACALERALSL